MTEPKLTTSQLNQTTEQVVEGWKQVVEQATWKQVEAAEACKQMAKHAEWKQVMAVAAEAAAWKQVMKHAEAMVKLAEAK